MRRGLLDEHDGDDPLLSVVNLIDVFLVLIAALLLAVASDPTRQDKVTVIRNAGKPDMEITVRDGQHVERYRPSDKPSAPGHGVKAGTAWRMQDGSVVYVPE